MSLLHWHIMLYHSTGRIFCIVQLTLCHYPTDAWCCIIQLAEYSVSFNWQYVIIPLTFYAVSFNWQNILYRSTDSMSLLHWLHWHSIRYYFFCVKILLIFCSRRCACTVFFPCLLYFRLFISELDVNFPLILSLLLLWCAAIGGWYCISELARTG